MSATTLREELTHNHFTRAYLRVAEETKKIRESPGSYGVRGEPPTQAKKPRKPKQQTPSPYEQLSLFGEPEDNEQAPGQQNQE